MTTKSVHSNIEILGKFYPIRCTEAELPALQEAAAYLNEQMKEVQASGKAINLERIAIITALNMANQILNINQQKSGLMDKINHRLVGLQEKLETALEASDRSKVIQPEFHYSTES